MIKLLAKLFKIKSLTSSQLVLVLFFSFLFKTSHAQLLDSLTLDTLTSVTSIEDGMKNPDAVIKLVLRKSHLKSFPMEILRFKNLQYLDVSKNKIEELPDSIALFNQLQYLACSKTGFKNYTKNNRKTNSFKILKPKPKRHRNITSSNWKFRKPRNVRFME